MVLLTDVLGRRSKALKLKHYSGGQPFGARAKSKLCCHWQSAQRSMNGRIIPSATHQENLIKRVRDFIPELVHWQESNMRRTAILSCRWTPEVWVDKRFVDTQTHNQFRMHGSATWQAKMPNVEYVKTIKPSEIAIRDMQWIIEHIYMEEFLSYHNSRREEKWNAVV